MSRALDEIFVHWKVLGRREMLACNCLEDDKERIRLKVLNIIKFKITQIFIHSDVSIHPT
jgi:hypothetical protein